jgi:hypothetical protein
MADINPVDFYKLEDAINRFWNVQDNIRLLTKRYIDRPERMSEDQMHDQLISLETMLELYIDAATDEYCKVFRLNDYAPEDVKERRAEMIANWSKNRQDWHNALTSLTPAPKKKGKKK